MPFPTSTILFLLWFSLACFVLSPYKLLLRGSVNSFQVLASGHPTVPVRLPLGFPQAAPAPPARGATPPSPENSRLAPTREQSDRHMAGAAHAGCWDRLPTQRLCQTQPFPRGLPSPAGVAHSPRAARAVSLPHGDPSAGDSVADPRGRF